jgi:hypothetical protein
MYIHKKNLTVVTRVAAPPSNHNNARHLCVIPMAETLNTFAFL